MDAKLRQLMQELAEVSTASLAESGAVAEVIGKIRGAGYDVSLLFEITACFHRRDGSQGESGDSAKFSAQVDKDSGEPKFTAQDARFAKEAHITLEDPSDA